MQKYNEDQGYAEQSGEGQEDANQLIGTQQTKDDARRRGETQKHSEICRIIQQIQELQKDVGECRMAKKEWND